MKAEIDNSDFYGMIRAMVDDPNGGGEEEVYFYHSDLCGSRAQSQTSLSYAEMKQSVRSNHLGSASWITDSDGVAIQHLQYLPYGERYVDQRMSGYSERFRFTGKERDEETGFGYFGARYMDHELMTMWLSVDPLADKYPSISPYAYCAWNPVKLVDPDGKWPWDPEHIKEARKYARKNDGTLNIWTERNGVKMASVTYAEATNPCEVTFSITVFQPKGYNSRGEIKPASGLANVELWMDSPSENIGESIAKGATGIVYGIPNDISMIISGKTLAGTEVSAIEREEAFAFAATNVFSPLLRFSGIATKTSAKGIKGYNEFVKKNPGIIKRLSRNGAGNAFQKNQLLQEGLIDNRKATQFLQGVKEVKDEMVWKHQQQD